MTETLTQTFDCSDPGRRAAGLAAGVRAARRGDLIVLPTDTVYGIGCDAFLPDAVTALLQAKGRGRDMPVPVLVSGFGALDAITVDVPDAARELAETFWPGALTLVCRAQPSLRWDLGDTRGTVAVRMPLHPVALDLLREVGPMAVSSANRSGSPPATTVAEAAEDLGESVAVYLDGGPSAAAVPSTIVDVTSSPARILREGALDLARLRDAAPQLLGPPPSGASSS